MEETAATSTPARFRPGVYDAVHVLGTGRRAEPQQQARGKGPYFLLPTWPSHTPHRSLARVGRHVQKQGGAIEYRLGHAVIGQEQRRSRPRSSCTLLRAGSQQISHPLQPSAAQSAQHKTSTRERQRKRGGAQANTNAAAAPIKPKKGPVLSPTHCSPSSSCL